MRPDEIEQYLAFVPAQTFDHEAAAVGFMNTPGLKFSLLGPDGFPACAGGYHEVLPGVWQSWMVGSCDGWKDGWRSITKASRWVADGLFEAGARRLQTNCLASRTRAIEWYERGLKLVREGTWRAYGLQGQDVALFSRVA